jgi:hypothetical protein
MKACAAKAEWSSLLSSNWWQCIGLGGGWALRGGIPIPPIPPPPLSNLTNSHLNPRERCFANSDLQMRCFGLQRLNKALECENFVISKKFLQKGGPRWWHRPKSLDITYVPIKFSTRKNFDNKFIWAKKVTKLPALTEHKKPPLEWRNDWGRCTRNPLFHSYGTKPNFRLRFSVLCGKPENKIFFLMLYFHNTVTNW